MKNINWITLAMGLMCASFGGVFAHKTVHNDTRFAVTSVFMFGSAIYITRRALNGGKL